MAERRNLDDPAEALAWQLIDDSPNLDRNHRTLLAKAEAHYRRARPDHSDAMAALFANYVAAHINAAARRITARHGSFAGLQIGGSA
jgi:hypothetical protein